ncbi:hypothetical protein MANY_21960 [Mycolicibacterium anyangense]|uniref:Uncharacterized protein n=1 Tax=Mycolicibacterium anyangense TaxID=1431246 RepID=A0A6N4W757_9MYCO|nr:hypothetical protein MANY_21960 [Mycolicibacterium anyangense]
MAQTAARTAGRDPSTPTTIDGGVNDSGVNDSGIVGLPQGWHSYCADVIAAMGPL